MRKFRILFCGLPVSAGQHSLAVIPGTDARQALSTLDAVVSDLAQASWTNVIVYKDFCTDDLEWTKPLTDLGYRQVPTLPMHLLRPSFVDFQDYRAALRSHYRYKVDRSRRKLKKTQIEVSVCSGASEIVRIYTPEVHDLYLQVVNHAAAKIETVSIEFFHELAARLEGRVELVLLSKQTRVVAFGWCLNHNSCFHMLFAGLDYALNAEADLYFNLMYAWIDRALRKQASRIALGQAAGEFKARLGCYPQPLYTYMKGRGPLMSALVSLGAGTMLAREPPACAHHVFRSDAVQGSQAKSPVVQPSGPAPR